MSRFFDEPVLNDDQKECLERCKNGGVSNEAYWNDYRNRMPFHYIEDPNTDGYYYWTFGATMNMQITLEDDFAYTVSGEDGAEQNLYTPIAEILKGSPTKFLRFVLKDFRGVVIETQELTASSLEYEGDKVKATFVVSEKLSAIMVPNEYNLYIYLIDGVSDDNGELQVNYQKCLTEQGILIRVRS